MGKSALQIDNPPAGSVWKLVVYVNHGPCPDAGEFWEDVNNEVPAVFSETYSDNETVPSM